VRGKQVQKSTPGREALFCNKPPVILCEPLKKHAKTSENMRVPVFSNSGMSLKRPGIGKAN